MLHQIHQDQQSQIQQGEQVSEHEESSQFIKVKYAGRQNFCQMCHNVLGKYTCPKCQMKTCSLQCTRKHKESKNCTGFRQPTQYVSKNDIDPRTVQKDYNFIQDMISNSDKVKKVLSGVNQTINLQPRRFKILRNNARQLYSIRLSNGPNILQRHRDNISFFFVKTKSIYWVFQLLYFVGKDNKHEGIKTSRMLTQPISDQKTFGEVLPDDHLDKTLLELHNINSTKREQFSVFLENKEKISEYSTQQQLKRHQNAVISQKVVNGKFVTFYQLIQYDLNKKVSDQLLNVSIFQYPTLYVVHNSLIEEFLECYKETKFKKGQSKESQKSKQRQKGYERQRSREKGSKKSSLRKIDDLSEQNEQ